MKTKTKIKWRLSKLPTPSELAVLVHGKIITQEEAHEVLFETKDEYDLSKTEALESEIKFLRKIIDNLSSKPEQVKIIKEYITKYEKYPWYQPYYSYCSAGSGVITTASTNGTYTIDNSTLSLGSVTGGTSLVTGTASHQAAQ